MLKKIQHKVTPNLLTDAVISTAKLVISSSSISSSSSPSPQSATWLILPTGCCLVDPANGLLPCWSFHNLRANKRPKKNRMGRGQSPTQTHKLTSRLLDQSGPSGPRADSVKICLTIKGIIYELLFPLKLDGVGPVDNRPSTN